MGGRGMGTGRSSSLDFLRQLGPRGKPHSIDEARKTSNPNFKTLKPEWTRNCQRCVFAYEMQRRGYDVEAKPRILDGTDTLPYEYNSKGWLNVMEGAKPVNMPSRNTQAKMDNQMSQWGDGARAIVKVRWTGRHSGHVFIAEQVNGATQYIDPQDGQYMDMNWTMRNVVHKDTQLIRVDNLNPTSLITECVQQKSK